MAKGPAKQSKPAKQPEASPKQSKPAKQPKAKGTKQSKPAKQPEATGPISKPAKPPEETGATSKPATPPEATASKPAKPPEATGSQPAKEPEATAAVAFTAEPPAPTAPPTKPPRRSPRATRTPAPSRTTSTLIDLSTTAAILPTASVPAEPAALAWARLGRVYGVPKPPKVWLASLSTVRGRLVRDFVDRATNLSLGYEIVSDDPFIKINRYAQEHPLVAGVYEASSACAGNGDYRGRAAFEVRSDGTIDLFAVGVAEESFPAEIQNELLRRASAYSDDAAHEVRGDDLMQRFGLPTLYGSEKQVRWALDIRQRVVERLIDEPPELRDARMVRVCEQTAAKWWIDHRDDALTALASE